MFFKKFFAVDKTWFGMYNKLYTSNRNALEGKMENKYDALKLENQLCFPLYAASREVIKQYRPYLDELGITYTQYITMMVMWERKRVNVKELGGMLYLDSGTLTPLLKSLEKKGFVKRERSSDDGRVLLVDITPEGEALKERAAKIPEKIAGCLRLTSDEAVQLYTLIYKLLDSFSN